MGDFRTLLVLAAAAILVRTPVCAAPVDPEDKPAGPLIGISMNVRKGGGQAELVRDIQALKDLGAHEMYVSYKWSDLEPTAGKLKLKPIEQAVGGLTMLGFRILITIQTIDTNNRTLPADLQNRPFDDPEMITRFDALLAAIAPKLNASVGWVMLGNEVDIYLGQHPAELEPFAGLMEHGRRTLRNLKPGLPVGVTCTFDGTRQRAAIARRVDRDMDVITLTYYPLTPDFGVRPPSDVDGDVDAMVRFAVGKRLLIQEAGYPADPLLGSSEAKQAQFVDAVFAAARKHASQIRLVNFFLLYDFGDALVETFLKYYRLPNPRFRAYLATLGFKRDDGTPREAWSHFESGLKAWSAAR